MEKILNDSSKLLVIESDYDNVKFLEVNRDNNSLNFKIEGSAISKVPLIQKGWNTKSLEFNEKIPADWKLINIISWNDLKSKYNMNFNVLVADCEGALYYLLKEEPNFLDIFETIIIENDFSDISHKQFVNKEFERYNLKNVYSKGEGFFEVWKK